MRIYVAGSRHEIITVRLMHTTLKELGHEVTYDWTKEENVSNGKPREDWLEHREEGKAIADAECQAVANADGLLICGWGSERALGTYIEIGMALAQGKPVVICGPVRNSIFWCLDEVVIAEDVKDGIAALEQMCGAGV